MFNHYKQQDQMDCGVICLRMVAKYYGRNLSIYKLRKLCQVTKSGVNMLRISDAAEKLGFRTQSLRFSIDQLEEIQLPCILHRRQNHFVVLYKIRSEKCYISYFATRLQALTKKEFTKSWSALSSIL